MEILTGGQQSLNSVTEKCFHVSLHGIILSSNINPGFVSTEEVSIWL